MPSRMREGMCRGDCLAASDTQELVCFQTLASLRRLAVHCLPGAFRPPRFPPFQSSSSADNNTRVRLSDSALTPPFCFQTLHLCSGSSKYKTLLAHWCTTVVFYTHIPIRLSTLGCDGRKKAFFVAFKLTCVFGVHHCLLHRHTLDNTPLTTQCSVQRAKTHRNVVMNLC